MALARGPNRRYSKRTKWTSWLPESHDVTIKVPSDTVRSRRATGKKLSAAEIALLSEQYRSGATAYQLAERFGIHRNTVSLHLHRRGVTMRRQGLDAGQVDHAVRLYQDGQPLARIADRYNVDPAPSTQPSAPAASVYATPTDATSSQVKRTTGPGGRLPLPREARHPRNGGAHAP